MKSLRADVLFLQETHFRADHIPKFSNANYPTVYHSVNTEVKAKGVSILIS
ncbi:unnamed protein product [Staurois parvus]|uniref:Endonuclease/exonuclease/phosphatase domain-containing protein n=1 Tax=Staurois parvus TaxID=386267 RepID=A0ABN9G2P3_9NEOB|nr:unnamed protein product [Staurois parvus]